MTHLISGALLGKAWKRSAQRQGTLLFATVAAVAPDIDNFVGGSPEAYLRHHRELTHSVFGGILVALALAGVLWLLRRKKWRFSSAFTLAYAAVLTHIFLDLATSYGTQIFFPFTDHRYTLESIFIIDPIFTVVLAALLIASRSSSRFAQIGLVLVFAYPLANFALREGAAAVLERRLRVSGEQFTRLHLTTEAFTPVFWKVLLEGEQQYRMGEFSLLRPLHQIDFESHPKANRAFLRELGEQARFLKTWEWFALYPAIERKTEVDGAEKLVLRDLRFHSFNPLLSSRARRLPFTVEVVLGSDGKVRSLYYRGEDIAETSFSS